MKLRDIAREAWCSALAYKVPTVTIALLTAAMCLVTLLTVGRSAHAEAQARDVLESAGSRMITVEVSQPNLDLLPVGITDSVAGLSITEVSIATSFPVDAGLVGLDGTEPTPLWWTRGDLSQMVSLVSGRWPDVGEALIAAGAAASYGLDGPIGAIETQSGEELAIVGTFQARDLFRSFAAGSLSPATDRHSMTTLIAVASTASESQALQSAVLQLIAPPDPQDLRVSSPATLADVQQSIGANLTQFSRSLLILVLMAGGVLTAIVVLADTLVRQRDLGRRRALGASRFSIVALVTARTALGATVGIVGGTSLAVVIARTSLPPTAFIAGVAVLAFFTATLSAAPPALLAAFRDPVTVLRTP